MLRQLRSKGWPSRPLFWTELFAIGNIGFLAVDVAVAHAMNAFEHPAEYIPVAFSLASAPLLLLAMLIGGPEPATRARPAPGVSRGRSALARGIGLLVGWGSLVVGIAGLILHLRGDFFSEMTLKNLVYTAPFAAPLAYAGLGFLVLLNRMVDARSPEWAGWVVVLAAGGWMGNFVLSLADHAQNGFFRPSEWAGVVSAAIAFGFLVAVLVVPRNGPLRWMTAGVMGLQMLVGLIGFYLHVEANLARPSASLWESFLYGAPAFAPLLFADLAILGLLGLWGLAANPEAPAD
ncbi:hypothetical protein [Planctomyces sp. SH-PL62]|uniref:hypothetical protein n=1 Tax=Planctomyces sp. SH-PL62 TaxID=1636152 RepID=UPI00078CFCC2|nr:hypothetical protein [Planctomyces sp. SH-PL62]AMV36896.1 hypothetical protein VT85_05660 [Planctomyces sp. SH-PL62]